MRRNVALFASQDLVQMLSSMKHEIAYVLGENIKYRSGMPITYLDFGSTNDTISFIYSNKLIELQNEHPDYFKDFVWNSKRSEMKVGKIIKMLYGNNFPINQQKGTIRKGMNNDIESFVNMFKSLRDKDDNKTNFELVNGKDIKFWYNQENYSRFIKEDTTLAKSCLRYAESGKFLEMYVNNPDIVNMLILKDDANKLRGRALVWNLTEPTGRIYMDRIYTVNDSDVELYKHFATEKGWLYKKRQTFGYDHYIVDSRTGEEKMYDQLLLKVKLNTPPKKYYPYLDTLSVYNRDEFTLCNDGRLLRKPPYLRLTDYQGSYFDDADYREMVYSNFYGQEIPREESEFVSIDQDWVYSHEVVHVHNTNNMTSHKNSQRIKKSVILGKAKYFLTEDCTFSEYLNTHIYNDSVREVYVDLEKTTKGLVHKKMLKRLFIEDANGDFVLTILDIVKKSDVKFENSDYNDVIKAILRNGRSDMRQLLTSSLIPKYLKQNIDYKKKDGITSAWEKKLYEYGRSMYGLDIDNNMFNIGVSSSHQGRSLFDDVPDWDSPTVRQPAGRILREDESEIVREEPGAIRSDRVRPVPRPVRRRRVSPNIEREDDGLQPNTVPDDSIESSPMNRVVIRRTEMDGRILYDIEQPSVGTSNNNPIDGEQNIEEIDSPNIPLIDNGSTYFTYTYDNNVWTDLSDERENDINESIERDSEDFI